MEIDPVTSGSPFFPGSEFRFQSMPHDTFSTLIALQECDKSSKSFLFNWMRENLRSFWSWLISWIPRKISSNDWIYFKIEDGEEGVNKYRLLHEGKKTENLVKMGLRTVYLNDLSFPDKKALANLPLMLDQIMEREGIDLIQTRSFPIAYRLWKCGLNTESTLGIGIPAATPMGRFFSGIISRAMEKRHALDDAGLFALEKIEEKLVMAVVADAFTYEGNLETLFQHIISEIEQVFPEVHLHDAATRLIREVEHETTREMVSFFRNQIRYAIPHGLDHNHTVDYPIPRLFSLANSLQESLDRELTMHIDHLIIFSKETR